MSNVPNPSFVLNTTTCDLLRGLAAQFRAAGETYPEWRHFYERSLPDGDWISLIRGCLDDTHYTTVMKDARSQHSASGDLRAERKLGWHRFQELVDDTWKLLPESLKGQNDNPEEGWYEIVYDRLAGTPLVNERRDDGLYGSYEVRELTVNSFEASATVIKSLLAEWGETDAQSVATSNRVQLFGSGEQPIIDGKKKEILTKARYNVVQALLEAGESGLSKDDLDKKSGHSDAHKLLKAVANIDADWKKVIYLPGRGGMGKHYRIL